MLKRESFPVANIYVPTARRKTLDLKRVDAIAHSILTEGQQTPILVFAFLGQIPKPKAPDRPDQLFGKTVLPR